MSEIKWEDMEAANRTLVALPITHKDKNGNYVTKDYFPVAQRIKAFRMCYPRGSIVTEMVSNANGVCVFRASVYDGELLLGTGHAQEKESDSYINQTSIVENTETSAIGRALGMVGFGVDADIASADEMVKAFNAQAALQSKHPKQAQAPQAQAPMPTYTEIPNPAEERITPAQVKTLSKTYQGERLKKLLEVNHLARLEDMTRSKASELIAALIERDKKKKAEQEQSEQEAQGAAKE